MLVQPTLTEGHYECRDFAETIPVFTDILGMEVIARRNETELVVKHPHTAWRLVVHAAGPKAKNKPLMNHYGWRVSSREEVEKAQEYLKKVKDKYRLPRVGRPSLLHIAYSFYFAEPGGNSLELEYYEPDAVKLSPVYGRHWQIPISPEESLGKGYVSQGLSHGTLECDESEMNAYRRFINELLGLEIVPLPPELPVFYLKDATNPWYVVVVPQKIRNYLSLNSRFTLEIDSAGSLRDTHETFAKMGGEHHISELGAISEEDGREFFFLCDLAKNWWEISTPRRETVN